MNDRIRLLAEQAGYELDMFGFGHWDSPECKKFARLIVEECQNNLTFHGYDDAADQLEWFKKNRFGVENEKN